MVQSASVSRLGALWTVKSDARHVITAYETQDDAINAARALLSSTGGGELVVKGADGQVMQRETVSNPRYRNRVLTVGGTASCLAGDRGSHRRADRTAAM
jgi:hypothetical protein